MKWLALFATVLWLMVPSVHARLGDTEKQITAQHPAAIATAKAKMGNQGTLLIIEDKDTEYTAGFLDGKCEVEVYRNLDDSKLKESLITGELKAYSKNWIPVECAVHDCLAAMSEDGKFFSKLGYSRTLDKYNTFTVFSDKWRVYAKDIVDKFIEEHPEKI